MADQNTRNEEARPMLHCVICGNLFRPRSSFSVTCGGLECQTRRQTQTQKERRKWMVLQEIPCVICGTLFRPRNFLSVTCGSAKCQYQRNKDTQRLAGLDERPQQIQCAVCDRIFEPRTRNAVICGDLDCKYARRRQTTSEYSKVTKAALQARECTVCGKLFRPCRSSIVTCGKYDCQSRQKRQKHEEQERLKRLIEFECEICKRTFHSATHTQTCSRPECRNAKKTQMKIACRQKKKRLKESREKPKQRAPGLEEGDIPERPPIIAAAYNYQSSGTRTSWTQPQAPAGSQILQQDLGQQPPTTRIPFGTTQPNPGVPHYTPTFDLYRNRQAQVLDRQFRQDNQSQLTEMPYDTMLPEPAFSLPVLMPSSYSSEQAPVDDQSQQDLQQEYSKVLSGSFGLYDSSFTLINDTGQDLTVDANQQLPSAAGSYLSGEVSGPQNVPPDELDMAAQELMNLDPGDDPIFQDVSEILGQEVTDLDPRDNNATPQDAQETTANEQLINSDTWDDPSLQEAMESAGQELLNLDQWDDSIFRDAILQREGEPEILDHIPP
ncbi:hypothetical protein EV127DRAFT_413977 [Xylaria flabelliformis]|nr:hypothetical protein EV127DRAFT_413977 [Xylaria flabelliformis]